ncbi:MAG: amidohydrolase, partial [Alphaproteobacteria bacterium]|nr:amidohydrolase [Alphaproteobacteria bacterium]
MHHLSNILFQTLKHVSKTLFVFLVFLMLLGQLNRLWAAEGSYLFINATIYGHVDADSIYVEKGRIADIGDAGSDRFSTLAKTVEVIDLEGGFLLPGFIDNHIHLAEGGEVNCFLNDERSLDEQSHLLRKCKENAAPHDWIIGYGTHLYIVLGEEEPYKNPRLILDEIFPDQPVIIMEQTSHAMYANSVALQRAGINESSIDPVGGKFMRDESGKLNGVLVDYAGDIVMEIAVNDLPNRDALFLEGLEYGIREAHKVGITAIGDGRTFWRRGMFEAWLAMKEDDALEIRASVRPWIYPELDFEAQVDFLKKAHTSDLSDQLIVNQVKIYIDGVPENGTALVQEPYAYTYFPDLPNGLTYIDGPRMTDILLQLDKLGFGAHIHGLGDKGISEALDAIEAARRAGSRQKYHITHLYMVDKRDLSRFEELDVTADFQISHPQDREDHVEEASYFFEQHQLDHVTFRPIKQIAETRANLVLSSDWSVNDINPLAAISHSVTEGSLQIDSAIDAYTIN